MATLRNPREFGDKRNQQHLNYHDRNRTFSSTTTDHYKNKLAQIGIQKDLREILERKRLQKASLYQEKEVENTPNSPEDWSAEKTQSYQRKVRFQEENVRIRRSKSFTSGTIKNTEKHFEEQLPSKNRSLKETNAEPSQSSSRNYRRRGNVFVDLYNPTNIKIELKTDSGSRKCTVDSNVTIPGVKCDIRNSRSILKSAEPKDKMSDEDMVQTQRSNEKFDSLSDLKKHRRSFNENNNKKKGEMSEQPPKQNRSAIISEVSSMNENLSNLSITENKMSKVQRRADGSKRNHKKDLS